MAAQFGLDIGAYSIKAVQVERKGKDYRLTGLGEIRTPAKLNSQAESDRRAIAEAIKKLVAEAGIDGKDVVLSLSEADIFSQVIELPLLSRTELASAINFEAEQYIPVPLNEVKLEYVVLSTTTQQNKENRMEVLLIAAKKEAVKQLVSLVETANLIPLALETEILSLVRIVNHNFKGNTLFLNLGANVSDIFIVQNQILRFTRILKTAGEALTRAIVRELNMEFLQAEQYKTSYGLDRAALEGKVAKVIIPTFNVILIELKKALNFFLQENPGIKINSLMIAGGGAFIPGLNAYLAETLNLEVITFDPFSSFIQDSSLQQLKGKAKFAAVTGLAIRED